MIIQLLKDALRGSPSDKLPPSVPQRAVTRPRYRRGGAIIVPVWGGEGNAVKELSVQLSRPFLGHASGVHLIDVESAHWLDRLDEILHEPVWFVLSYFGAGMHLLAEDGDSSSNLWEAFGIPFVRMYGDTPAYFPATHRITSRNVINAYGFREHAEFFLRWNRPTGVTVTVPSILIDPVAEEEVDFAAKTAGRIIFPKNGNDPLALIDYWRTRLPPTVAQSLERIGETITAKDIIDQPLTIEEHVFEHYRNLGVDITDDRPLWCFLVAQLDDYLRRVKSTMIVRALLNLPIEVRGSNWQHVDFSGRAARYVPDSTYGETRELMKTALAILDMSPNTHHHPHDRPLRAAGRHTAFLTNSQVYLRERFENHRDFTFNFSPNSIREVVGRALDNPARTIEMGRAQAATMRSFARDEDYARTFIAAVDACELKIAGRPPDTQKYVSFRPE